ncbi:5-oxoprolinase subunit PxpB [Bhargavaea beijingensis]|uniref:5-oxoprolinase subunit PxpB n=1 Tax=Bhargavaea beijingensis TaxID=426756 RepID=A0A1G6ZZW7_9BACL|nr:5-oxoprolinase subunit PxpB [Bhargavaea beijingensis]MCW1927214.1 5-oxoprolinase subunit PxpB [Bhargavaea beijingensis]RSK35653.1 5-oxoprolinase subunit PxpB [Bhargavaea beijingensis]SDE07365.1 inhibitor of KinA [Bhargavaea beijingensis]
MKLNYHPLGDGAIVVTAGESIGDESTALVRAIAETITRAEVPVVTDVIQAYVTVTVCYEAENGMTYRAMEKKLRELLSDILPAGKDEGRTVEVPVCYGGDFGPDLGFVAEHNGLTQEEVIRIHSGTTYDVKMIGFAPGFPFLGGMDERIAAPRRPSPRLEIPARTVGIAGAQTGVYPIGTPGGWQLIGRTPVELFLPDKEIPSLLRPGDQVRFRQISKEEYEKMGAGGDAQD